MAYSQSEFAAIKAKIIAKISFELELAQENGTLDEFIEKYGIVTEKFDIPVNKRMKILVIGRLAGNLNDYIMNAKKKLGLSSDVFQFETDYDRLTNYNAERLRYSNTYSDIICGPIPHSVKGKGDNSSIISMIENSPREFPNLVKASANESLKISVSGFIESIRKTRYFEEVVVG